MDAITEEQERARQVLDEILQTEAYLYDSEKDFIESMDKLRDHNWSLDQLTWLGTIHLRCFWATRKAVGMKAEKAEKAFKEWWQENQLSLQGYISDDDVIPKAIWLAAWKYKLEQG